MNPITQALIESVNWNLLRTGARSSAGLSQAFDDLWRATSEAEADNAYWRIDNVVIVQGELYEAAVPALEVLLSMASTIPPGPARRSLAELIQQIAFGEPHSSGVVAGNLDVETKCRALAAGAIWIFYGWLTDDDDDVRQCALLTLQKVDQDQKRRAVALVVCREADPSAGMQKILTQIEQRVF